MALEKITSDMRVDPSKVWHLQRVIIQHAKGILMRTILVNGCQIFKGKDRREFNNIWNKLDDGNNKEKKSK